MRSENKIRVEKKFLAMIYICGRSEFGECDNISNGLFIVPR
ncbi:hypothetical protein DFR33_102397 [Bradymonas sediminis]|nr:hypothetical protein DFR33_102397 [Bradymonas sediminis]